MPPFYLRRTSPGRHGSLIFLFILVAFCPLWSRASVEDTADSQRYELFMAQNRCSSIISNVTRPTNGGLYCDPIWDNLMCWPDYVKAGETATQPCAKYIVGFNPLEKARRSCTVNGTWGLHPDYKVNKSWTDFGSCFETREPFKLPAIIEQHMPMVHKISIIGYSVSLGILIVATAIMIFFKKLHCQRNIIHINLFLSVMLRAVTALLRHCLLVRGLALPIDVIHGNNGDLIFKHEGTHWECRLLTTFWQYSINANYMWIFVEGLYLHTLIFFAVFSQSKRFFKLYIVIGWVFPLIFIITWVLVRIFKNNTLCWTTHEKGFYWILNAPIVVSISINFFFFLNIIRVLFTKIRDCNTRDPRRYRKLAKSTLVLIPLFGVYYIFFIVLDNYRPEPIIAVGHMYVEMTLNSFQGTIVALLFCFCNGEVQSEIRKKWHRHWLRRQSVASGRSSRAFSTSSFYIGRDRSSVSHGVHLCDGICRDGTRGISPPQSPLNNNNGRSFHKVASMPKISLANLITTKAIPRVASSPKVTFNCPEASRTTSTELVHTAPDVRAHRNYGENLLKGRAEFSQDDEETCLISKSETCTHVENLHSSVQAHKGACSVKEGRALKSNVVTGNDDGQNGQPSMASMNGLPPLPDVEEDSAET